MSFEGPVRYRSLEDLYDATSEVQLDYEKLCLAASKEPTSVDDAMRMECWKKAMEDEMSSIQEKKTWELTHYKKNNVLALVAKRY